MAWGFFICAMLSMVGVLGSLIMGLIGLSRGEKKDNSFSNRMMQVRVALQGMTAVFLLLSYLTK